MWIWFVKPLGFTGSARAIALFGPPCLGGFTAPTGGITCHSRLEKHYAAPVMVAVLPPESSVCLQCALMPCRLLGDRYPPEPRNASQIKHHPSPQLFRVAGITSCRMPGKVVETKDCHHSTPAWSRATNKTTQIRFLRTPITLSDCAEMTFTDSMPSWLSCSLQYTASNLPRLSD